MPTAKLILTYVILSEGACLPYMPEIAQFTSQSALARGAQVLKCPVSVHVGLVG